MKDQRRSAKRLISIFLTFVLVLTSVMLPTKSVTAASKKQIKSVALTINKTKVTNKKVTLYLGEKCKLLVTVKPSTAKKSVKYKSSNAKVVYVDKKGNLIAKKAGKATITVTVTPKKGKKKAAKVTVTVSKKFSLDKKSIAMKKGATTKLKANAASFHTVKWKSSNTKVATVKNGSVKAKNVGTATITATIGKVKTSVKVKVSKKSTTPQPSPPNPPEEPTIHVTGVEIDENSISLDIGQTKQLKATVKPENATDRSVSWRSEDSTIASVNAQGIVEAKAAGETKIVVTTNEKAFKAECNVKVNAKEADGLKIEVPNQLSKYSSTGKSVIMMGNDANVQVRCINHGSPMTNVNVKLTMEPQYGNANDAYAIKGMENQWSAFEKTNENGYVAFPISLITKHKDLDSLSGYYQSYKLTVSCQDNGMDFTSSSSLCFASVEYSATNTDDTIYVANQYDEALPAIEPSLNATGSGVARTKSKNGEFDVQYVTSQQVSTDERPHAVTLAISPVLTIPATSSEAEMGDYEKLINRKSGSYSVYNDETNEKTTTIIESIPAGLEWARIYFDDIRISQYTKIQIKFFDRTKKEQIGQTKEINANSFTEDSKVVQIPVQQDHDVYAEIALISAGQVDEGNNDGYEIAKIAGEWRSSAKDFYSFENLDNAVTWEIDSNFARSTSVELPYQQAQQYLPKNSQYLSENNTYTYRVPAFPSVGNAVLDVKSPDQKVVATFLYPSINSMEDGIYQNENVIAAPSANIRAFNASSQEVEQSVGELVADKSGITVDSRNAGYTPLKATIDYSSLGVKSDKTVLYTSVQWSPVENSEMIETKDFYAVKGQQVEVTVQLYDSRNNKVAMEGQQITLYQGTEELDESFIVGTPNYTTGKDGNCLIKIKNPSASVLALEDLNAKAKSYNIKLMIKSDQGVEHANIYWADLGLYFCSDVLDSDEKSTEQKAFLETQHIRHSGVVETRVFAGSKSLGKHTEKLDVTDTGEDISLSREVGHTWIFGMPVVGYVKDGTQEKIAEISGVNVQFAKKGVGEKVGEDNEKATYTLKSEKIGDSVLTGTIDNASLGDHIVFTILDEAGQEKRYQNVGTGTAEINASIDLVLNWTPVGMNLNIIPPLGEQLDITTKTKLYFSLKDSFDNPLSGKTITYSIKSAEIPELVVTDVSLVTDSKGMAMIEIDAPGKSGNLTIDAKYDSALSTKTIVYADSGIQEKFSLQKAVINKVSSPYKVAVEFSHALDAKSVQKDAFRIYKTAAPTDEYQIASAQIDANNSNIVILTLDGEGLKDVKSSEVTLAVSAYEDADGIEYQIIDNKHRLLPEVSTVTLEDQK